MLFVQRIDKVLNFRYNKGSKDRKLHKLCCRYAVCFRYFCDVSYPQLRELKRIPVQLLALQHVTCILPAVAGIETALPVFHPRLRQYVSYPQLRELKHGKNHICIVLDDVSYPQLRELKPLLMILLITFADVSYPQLRELKPSSCPATWSYNSWYVSYPQLRELKLSLAMIITESERTCILPATAGILF